MCSCVGDGCNRFQACSWCVLVFGSALFIFCSPLVLCRFEFLLEMHVRRPRSCFVGCFRLASLLDGRRREGGVYPLGMILMLMLFDLQLIHICWGAFVVCSWPVFLLVCVHLSRATVEVEGLGLIAG